MFTAGEVAREEPAADCSLCAPFDAAAPEDALIMSGPAAEDPGAASDLPQGARTRSRRT